MLRRGTVRQLLCAAAASASTSTSASAADGAATPTADERPVSSPFKHQVAVVGAGPSGCYVAQQLLKLHPGVHVDVYEKLPVPFGLSRYGVAPDHPEVKNVEKTFATQLFSPSSSVGSKNKSATSDRCSLLCHVDIGVDVPFERLCSAYSAVVIASGAPGERRMGIPGESLVNVTSSRRFVEWYNTTPAPHGSPLSCPVSLRDAHHVVLVGNGNVALDIARVLAAPYLHFCPTDMNCFAVRDLMNSHVKRVTVVARRGVEHAAFSIKEFRELTKLDATVKVAVEPFDLEAAMARAGGAGGADAAPRGLRRKLELMKQFEVASFDDPAIASFSGRIVIFRFGLAPKQILAHSPKRRTEVGAMVFSPAARPPSGNGDGDGDGDRAAVIVPCDAVVSCVGYLGEKLKGPGAVPFDSERHVGPTDGAGRVVTPAEAGDGGGGWCRWRHVYASGWARNGPRGVIVNALSDAQQVAQAIVADLAKWDAQMTARNASVVQELPPKEDEEDVMAAEAEDTDAPKRTETATTTGAKIAGAPTRGCLLDAVVEANGGAPPHGKYDLVDDFVERKVLPLGVSSVQRIWRVEIERGVDLGKRMEKIAAVSDMLNIATGGKLSRKTEDRLRGRYVMGRPPGLELFDEYLDSTTTLADLSQLSASGFDAENAAHRAGSRLDAAATSTGELAESEEGRQPLRRGAIATPNLTGIEPNMNKR